MTAPEGALRLVLALGGNALMRRGEPQTAESQRRNLVAAAEALARVARRHDVIVTHGNGPQVGLLALRAEAGGEGVRDTLDVLGAESVGMIGYLLAQELRNELPERRVATLLTEVEVDPGDPAFAEPSKPIGPMYEEAEARRLAERRGWAVAPDGDRWRRVVPSPEPGTVLDLETIRLLIEHDVLVICGGGGGIPVVSDAWGRLHGVEAVIDKDRTAALLAVELEADALVLLTDVDEVQRDWGTPRARPIREATAAEMRALELPAGSMGPKVEACCRFVEATGRWAAIGCLDDAAAIVAGESGTRITAG